jgi:D-alanyl-D-alanine carboxypeptidase
MLEGLNEFVVAGLQVWQTPTVEELLYLTLLPSDGDAAQALAIYNAGSIENFANLMNQKAAELGMTNTHFSNPVGLDTDNYSTARDIATLLNYAIQNPEFKTIFETYSYYSPTLGKTVEKTIAKNEVILGAKTGFTYSAGRCLASTANLNNVPYLLVNLNADYATNNHVTDALTVYNYFATNYGYKTIKTVGENYLTLGVLDSATTSMDFAAKENIEAYLKNDFDLASLTYDYEGVNPITNDNYVGEQLGTLQIKNQDEVLYETAIYFETAIDFYPYWLWNTGVVAGVIVIVLAVVGVVVKNRK